MNKVLCDAPPPCPFEGGPNMASSSLNLHAGGQLVSLEELRELKAPEPEGRWVPVPHELVYARVRETLEAAGYHAEKEQLAVARHGDRFFGVLDLATSVGSG